MCSACRTILKISGKKQEKWIPEKESDCSSESGPTKRSNKLATLAKGSSKGVLKAAAAASKSESRRLRQREKGGKNADDQRVLRGQPKIHIGSEFAQERASIRELANLNARRLGWHMQGFVCREIAQGKCLVKMWTRPGLDPSFPSELPSFVDQLQCREYTQAYFQQLS